MWARGSCDVVPHFSTVNSWWPLLPYSSAKPFIGTRDVPVANWSSRERISLLNEYTALSTDTDTMYHHHYPVNYHYYRWTWISRFPLGCSSPTCSGSEPLEICERAFYGPDDLPAIVKALMGTQSTNPNQWPGLIFSSSITGLLTEGALLHLCQLSMPVPQ